MDLKVEFVGKDGKFDTETINGDRIIELMVKHDTWDLRTIVSRIIKYELNKCCYGVIDIEEVSA